MNEKNNNEPQVLDSLVRFKHGTDVSGMVIGERKLVIINEEERREVAGIKRRFFRVQCQDCPNEFVAQASNLQLGLSKSCGCLRGRPLPAEQRPHSDKSYLRLMHLGLTYQNEQLPIDCDAFANEVIANIGNREHSGQTLVKLDQSQGWVAGNLAWIE